MPASPAQPRRGSFRLWPLAAITAMIVAGILLATALPASSGSDGSDQLTHRIARGPLEITVVEQGTLESSENTEIKCRVRGWSQVTRIVESGTIVAEGDELVRLDTKRVEDAISLHTTDTHTARATLERSIADLKQAEMAEEAYLEGTYKTQRQSLQREIQIARTNLETAEQMLEHTRRMFNQGYVTNLEVESNEFTVTQAKLELEVKENQLEVLEKYTKQMELETIRGNLAGSKAKVEADRSGLAMDEGRRDRSLRELEMCIIRAPRSGMVIYPSAAAWKDTPDVSEGANVRRDQTLLLMPDLDKMQIKVGIHESIIDRIEPGMPARIELTDLQIDGCVESVAAVARPAGWWTGNVVKYDCVIDIPQTTGLKPGMSAEVTIQLASLPDAVQIPVAAVVETEAETLCWVRQPQGFERRTIVLGGNNDVFIEVVSGLQEGDEVALNPTAFLDAAELERLRTFRRRQEESKQDTAPEPNEAPASAA